MIRAGKKKKNKPKEKVVTRTVTQEWLDGVIANAEERAKKDAKAEMLPQIKEGASAATSHAFAYLVGVTINIMAGDFNWNMDECNWMVERMLEEYNKTTDIKQLLKDIEEKSGCKLELDEKESYWM